MPLEINPELVKQLATLKDNIVAYRNQMMEAHDYLTIDEAFAIIYYEQNLKVSARMKELVEVKRELYSIKAQIQIATNEHIMGQTAQNTVIPLNGSQGLLDKNGRPLTDNN